MAGWVAVRQKGVSSSGFSSMDMAIVLARSRLHVDNSRENSRLLGEHGGSPMAVRDATHYGAKNRDQPKGSKLRPFTRPHQSIAIAVALNSVVVRPAKIMVMVSPGS
jgi:hypothetical protein